MRDNASRFGAIALVAGFTVLSVSLSPVIDERHYALFAVSIFFAAVTLAAAFSPQGAIWRKAEVPAATIAVVLAFAVNTYKLVQVIDALTSTQNVKAMPLLHSAIALWFANIVVFTLAYWLMDAGGPVAREEGVPAYPDFDFPARSDPSKVRPGWRPTIVDYLFIGFTTNTSFGPTEAMPLTGRAKALLMVQSLVSLVTIAGIAARAVGITAQ